MVPFPYRPRRADYPTGGYRNLKVKGWWFVTFDDKYYLFNDSMSDHDIGIQANTQREVDMFFYGFQNGIEEGRNETRR